MPLTKVQIAPGFNKQVTQTGAEGKWTDGDFVRFRYGLPEKIGGWSQITSDTLLGKVTTQLVYADLDGNIYAALGTNKTLLIFYEEVFYDITPLDAAITGATFTTVNNNASVTVNKSAHGLSVGDLFTFTSVTPPTGAGYTAANFTTNTFQVVTTPTIPAFIESGDFNLADGEVFISMRRFIPDFKLMTGNTQVTIQLKDYPSDTEASSPLGPFTITSTTNKIDTRARGRFASLKIANTSTDENWRFGTFRADIQPDGMRG